MKSERCNKERQKKGGVEKSKAKKRCERKKHKAFRGERGEKVK
jgi:hypothetical protein